MSAPDRNGVQCVAPRSDTCAGPCRVRHAFTRQRESAIASSHIAAKRRPASGASRHIVRAPRVPCAGRPGPGKASPIMGRHPDVRVEIAPRGDVTGRELPISTCLSAVPLGRARIRGTQLLGRPRSVQVPGRRNAGRQPPARDQPRTTVTLPTSLPGDAGRGLPVGVVLMKHGRSQHTGHGDGHGRATTTSRRQSGTTRSLPLLSVSALMPV